MGRETIDKRGDTSGYFGDLDELERAALTFHEGIISHIARPYKEADP
jgi:hypothetical protein